MVSHPLLLLVSACFSQAEPNYVLAMPAEVPDDVIIHGVLLQKQNEPEQYAKRYEEIELEGGTTLILDRRTNRIQAMETLAKMLDEAELADGKPATFITLDEETAQLLREDVLLSDTGRGTVRDGSLLYINPTIAIRVNGRTTHLDQSFPSSMAIAGRLVEASANARTDPRSDRRDERGRGIQLVLRSGMFTIEQRRIVAQRAMTAIFEREAAAHETLARSFYGLFGRVSAKVFDELSALPNGAVTLGQLPSRLRQELAHSLRLDPVGNGFANAGALEEFLASDNGTVMLSVGIMISVPTPSSPGNSSMHSSYIPLRNP